MVRKLTTGRVHRQGLWRREGENVGEIRAAAFSRCGRGEAKAAVTPIIPQCLGPGHLGLPAARAKDAKNLAARAPSPGEGSPLPQNAKTAGMRDILDRTAHAVRDCSQTDQLSAGLGGHRAIQRPAAMRYDEVASVVAWDNNQPSSPHPALPGVDPDPRRRGGERARHEGSGGPEGGAGSPHCGSG